MKRTLIATVAATAAILAAAYLTGADSTATPAPATTHDTHGTHGTTGTQPPMLTQMQTQMQGPVTETETIECDDYILLIPCPVCHTCPVCQSNCGTAHALRCCIGNKKPVSGASVMPGASGTSATPTQQHVMTNKAEAVKNAANRTATAPPMQTESGTLSIITVESD